MKKILASMTILLASLAILIPIIYLLDKFGFTILFPFVWVVAFYVGWNLDKWADKLIKKQ